MKRRGVREGSRLITGQKIRGGMAGFKFTLKSVEAATCPTGKQDAMFFDTETRGFGLRVTAKGSRTFLAQYSTPAGKRRVVLGPFGVLTIDEARRRARSILGEAAAGRDPVLEQRQQHAAAAAARKAAEFTFRRLVEDWAEARDGERRPSYLREAKACLIRHLKRWLDRPASGISVADAVEELDPGSSARKVRSPLTVHLPMHGPPTAGRSSARRSRSTLCAGSSGPAERSQESGC